MRWFCLCLAAVMFLGLGDVYGVLTIQEGDILVDGQGYYYEYEFDWSDMSTGNSKFVNDTQSYSNVGPHYTSTATPRWIYAVAGETTAEIVFEFDFSAILKNGKPLKITQIELRDKLSMANNVTKTENCEIISEYSTNGGGRWFTFNSATTPSGTTLVHTLHSDTFTYSGGTHVDTFLYRVQFYCYKSGFDADKNLWNYLRSDSVDEHFRVFFRLDYDVFSGGTGTSGDPYLISSQADLDYLGGNMEYYDEYFRMTQDIVLSGTYTTAVIAPDTDELVLGFNGPDFTGVFDGDGHLISELKFFEHEDENPRHYLGLFGQIGLGGEVHSLGVSGNIYPGQRIEGKNLAFLAGANLGTIDDCTIGGYLRTDPPSEYIGGLVGSNSGIVTDCSSSALVIGGDNVGGLIGSNYGAVSGCTTTSEVIGEDFVGGLIGYCQSDQIIELCFSRGSVEGDNIIGGLIGYMTPQVSSCTLRNSYSTAKVLSYSTTVYSVGGLIGETYLYTPIQYCYALCDIYVPLSFTNAGGFIGYVQGTNINTIFTGCFQDTTSSLSLDPVGSYTGNPVGLTNNVPTSQSSYTAVGWDFVEHPNPGDLGVWGIDEGVLPPQFGWECVHPAFDLNGDCMVDLYDYAISSSEWLSCGYLDPKLCP